MGVVGILILAAIGVGVAWNRLRRRLPWAGVATSSTGDVLSTVLAGGAYGFPTAADWLYLAVYPLLGLSLIGLARAQCEYGQGFLFARPMSGTDAMAWATKTALAPVT